MENSVSAEQKSKLIEKYRDINVDHDYWYEDVIQDFKTDMLEFGITVERVYFTGFWSQGDGACFEGNAFFPKFMDNFDADKYPMIRKLLKLGGSIYFNSNHDGHYHHENSVSYSYEVEDLYHVMDAPSEFQEDIREVYQKQLDIEAQRFEEEAIELFRDKMREVYRTLGKAYEYYTEDEAVWEAIVANELHLITYEE